MLFNSYLFIFAFLPLTLAGYFALARRGGRGGRRAALAFLVLASIVHYGWWNPGFVPLILLSIVGNFALGRVLSSARQPDRVRRAVLVAGIAANLALLAYYKYAGFLAANLNALAGTHLDVGTIVLPLGISFYTFQQVAFLVDAYRRETHEYGFIEYALFVTYFPQLIAGPIVHHKEMLPQFTGGGHEPARPRADNLAIGISWFTAGLFKKVILADQMSLLANPVFDGAAAGAAPALLPAWIGALAYTFQIYFDFSGYSDMAMGLGRMFGITLPLNFNSPYKAASPIEFWRRWHMTLSRFLRDYLYIPLGGNRHGVIRRHANLLITMLLGGLWHGASWTFVAWGGLHGVALVLNHAWRAVAGTRGQGTRAGRIAVRIAGTAFTFLLVVVGWVLFRATSFEAARSVLAGMVGLNGGTLAHYDGRNTTLAILGGLLLWVWALPNTQEVFGRALDERAMLDAIGLRIRRVRLAWRPGPVWAIGFAAAFVWSVMNLDRVQEFLYWQF